MNYAIKQADSIKFLFVKGKSQKILASVEGEKNDAILEYIRSVVKLNDEEVKLMMHRIEFDKFNKVEVEIELIQDEYCKYSHLPEVDPINIFKEELDA